MNGAIIYKKIKTIQRFKKTYGIYLENIASFKDPSSFMDHIRNNPVDIVWIGTDGVERETIEEFALKVKDLIPNTLIHLFVSSTGGLDSSLMEFCSTHHFFVSSIDEDAESRALIDERMIRVFSLSSLELEKVKSMKTRDESENLDLFLSSPMDVPSETPISGDLLSTSVVPESESKPAFVLPNKTSFYFYDLPKDVREDLKRKISFSVSAPYFEESGDTPHKKKIAVLSLYPGSGASFVVNNAAIGLAEKGISVGVLEAIQKGPHLFERLGGEERMPSTWECWYKNARENTKVISYEGKEYTIPFVKPGLVWKEHGVYWIPQHPKTFLPTFLRNGELSIAENLAVYYTAATLPLLLIDVSSEYESDFTRFLLEEADEIWIVTGLHFLRFKEGLRRVLPFVFETSQGKDIFLIFNQDHAKLDKTPFLSLLGEVGKGLLPPLTTIPFSPMVIEDDYQGRFSLLDRKRRSFFLPSFSPLFDRLANKSRLSGGAKNDVENEKIIR